jgi:hypothetical protein
MDTTVNMQDFVNNFKSNGWQAMREAVTDFIRLVIERVLSLEQYGQVASQPYERSGVDYANGSYERTLSTTYGVISRLPGYAVRGLLQDSLRPTNGAPMNWTHALLTWYLQAVEMLPGVSMPGPRIYSHCQQANTKPGSRAPLLERTSIAVRSCCRLVRWLGSESNKKCVPASF